MREHKTLDEPARRLVSTIKIDSADQRLNSVCEDTFARLFRILGLATGEKNEVIKVKLGGNFSEKLVINAREAQQRQLPLFK